MPHLRTMSLYNKKHIVYVIDYLSLNVICLLVCFNTGMFHDGFMIRATLSELCVTCASLMKTNLGILSGPIIK